MIQELGAFVAAMGIGALVSGWLRERQAREAARAKVHTRGRVVRHRVSPGTLDDPGETWYPVVEFVTADDERVEVERDWGASPGLVPAVGAEVDVWFDPRAPRLATVGSPTGGRNRLMMAIGAALAVVGLVFVVVGSRI